MVFKGLTAATAAIALAASPAIAQTASMPTTELAPAAESVQGSEQARRGSVFIIVIAVILVGLGIWAATNGGDDAPDSP